MLHIYYYKAKPTIIVLSHLASKISVMWFSVLCKSSAYRWQSQSDFSVTWSVTDVFWDKFIDVCQLLDCIWKDIAHAQRHQHVGIFRLCEWLTLVPRSWKAWHQQITVNAGDNQSAMNKVANILLSHVKSSAAYMRFFYSAFLTKKSVQFVHLQIQFLIFLILTYRNRNINGF